MIDFLDVIFMIYEIDGIDMTDCFLEVKACFFLN